MALVRATDLDLHFGHHVILDNASFQLQKGERVCLVGRNGAGKSTLLKLVEGEIQSDGGNIWRQPGMRLSRLDQELPQAGDTTVLDFVASGLAELGQLLSEFDHLAHQELDEAGLKRLDRLQHEIDARDGWTFQQSIDEVLSRLELPREKKMSELSGGWRRRVALAKALVISPDILLLDEPTNHLDIEAIQWLEKQLLQFQGAILFITHDRSMVRSLATQILELDRGTLRLFQCGYDKYLEEREHLLEVEEQQNALFDKRLAQEEVWIRQGIKARRTRNEGRVRALKKMREQRSQRRQQTGKARIDVETSGLSGKLVAELKAVSVAFDGNTLFENLNLTIVRGDKIGLIGPNGVGKSTLLKVILGELQPDAGQVKLGTKLDIAYFDQMREMLDGEKTIVDTVGQGRDSITINGKDRHVLSYLSDFLFSPERARTPLRALSGGERNRVQLACLFSQPANILVMDEPTNDLDMETLELLESILVEFTGTVLLVSHDRDFMDNVVTSSLAFEGQAVVREYVGGYKDWLRQGGSFRFHDNDEATQAKVLDTADKDVQPVAPAKKKLSYKLQRELDQLPEMIETLEQQQEAIQAQIGDPNFYQGDKDLVADTLKTLADVEAKLEQSLERWMELSED
jgi:ATP-binding cassette subfamily F protein uup